MVRGEMGGGVGGRRWRWERRKMGGKALLLLLLLLLHTPFQHTQVESLAGYLLIPGVALIRCSGVNASEGLVGLGSRGCTGVHE